MGNEYRFFVFLLLSWLLSLFRAEFVDPSDFFTGTKPRPRLKITYPENGQVLEHGDLVIKIQLDDYQLPSQLHGSSICVALSWTHSHGSAVRSGGSLKQVAEPQKSEFAEQCFEEVPDLSFQAFGLSPGTQYTLRVALYERSNAIAVSVRSFRVAGIRGLLNSDEVLTIQTAVRVAMEYQTRGLEAQAEQIYRSILSEAPQHADALHLLGVIFYQKGDANSAVPYIERALATNKSFEGFHNSLGVCYRTLGRVHEAEHQFKLALALNPAYHSAVFNLGLTYQHLNRWSEAIAHFRRVTEAAADPAVAAQLTPQVLLDAKVRECDLLQSQMLLKDARPCWEQAQRSFPRNLLVLIELGNVLSQLNEFDEALLHYQSAFELGSYTAELSVAHILEIQGYERRAKAALEVATGHAEQRGLHSYHVKVRRATVLPRILPPLEEIPALRARLSEAMTSLLEATEEVEVDNSPPLYSGYSTGFHLLFHGLEGENNILLKSQLFRLYSTMCPALLQGYFMELQLAEDLRGGSSRSAGTGGGGGGWLEQPSNTNSTTKRVPLRPQAPTADSSSTPASAGAGAAVAAGTGERSAGEPTSEEDALKRHSAETADLFALGTPVPRPRRPVTGTYSSSSSSGGGGGGGGGHSKSGTHSSPTGNGPGGVVASVANSGGVRKVRIGFLSRFMHTHPVGLLVQGLVEVLRGSSVASGNGKYRADKALETLLSPKYLAEQWRDANSDAHSLRNASAVFHHIEFEVIVFLVDGGKGTAQYDAVQRKILKDAHMAYVLPSQHIGTCAQAIRNARLDILVYPELGLDPLAYFLAYSRLAPVQATWLGHPDTSALPTVDYFLSSHFEPPSAQTNYTERLYKMPFFGTQFVDAYLPLAQVVQSAPRTVILNRAKYVETMQIPKSAHLYIISHSLCKLHPLFDEVLQRILLQDRLGYLLFIDVTSWRPSWQQLLVERILAKLGPNAADFKTRIVFQTPESAHDAVHIMQLGHVMLDPFPVTGDYQPSLEALAIGLPVVTLPSQTHIGGSFTLALYHMLGYGYQPYDSTAASAAGPSGPTAESNPSSPNGAASAGNDSPDSEAAYTPLVVSSVQEYINLALRLTHQPKLRQFHTERLLSRRHRLFQQDHHSVLAQWRLFAHLALEEASRRNDSAPPPPPDDYLPDILEIPVDLPPRPRGQGVEVATRDPDSEGELTGEEGRGEEGRGANDVESSSTDSDAGAAAGRGEL